MKLLSQIFGSAFLMHIIIRNTSAIYPNPWGLATSNWRNPLYRPRGFDYERNPEIFSRNIRSRNPSRMLSIDLSNLMPGSKEMQFRSRHKPPANMLGIDISVLSQNPDPKMPIAPSALMLPGSRKIILRDNFDPRYDRLPVITTKAVPEKIPVPYNRARNGLVYPFHHLPLNVVTTYHTIMTNKKEDQNVNSGNEFDRDEKEKKYTSDFILHLLYQLSSNSRKEISG